MIKSNHTPIETLWIVLTCFAKPLMLVNDEPLVNQYFETIDEIEEILVKRCNILNNMTKEIQDLTNYYWLANI